MVIPHDTNPDIKGVRAAIMTPLNHDFVLPSVTASLMRVSAERGNGLGLIQIGYGRTWSQPVSDCGIGPQDGKLYMIFEWIIEDPLNPGKPSPHCEWHQRLSRGSSDLYTVYRRVGSSAPNAWEANFNGQYVVSKPLDFSNAGTAVAGGEIMSSSAAAQTFIRPDGTVYGCYGCKKTPKGLIPWQWTTQAGSTGWKKVAAPTGVEITSDHYPTDGRWVVDGFPTAFYVQHFCLADHSRGC